jgi:predicted  nucleic acid-binding Zn-ribbon protein
MSGHLEDIVELYTALQDLKASEDVLNGIPEWMQELHEEYSARKAELDELESQIEDLVAERRASEAVVEDSQEKLRHFQEQIGRVRNQREYAAVLQEIDSVKEVIRRSEDQALGTLASQDQAQTPRNELQAEFSDLNEKYAVELAKWEAQKPDVAQEADRLRSKIDSIKERLTPAVQKQFERIYERHKGVALAPIRKLSRLSKGPQIEHCGICNYRVRPQIVVEIKNHGNIVQCDNCARILYIDEELD